MPHAPNKTSKIRVLSAIRVNPRFRSSRRKSHRRLTFFQGIRFASSDRLMETLQTVSLEQGQYRSKRVGDRRKGGNKKRPKAPQMLGQLEVHIDHRGKWHLWGEPVSAKTGRRGVRLWGSTAAMLCSGMLGVYPPAVEGYRLSSRLSTSCPFSKRFLKA